MLPCTHGSRFQQVLLKLPHAPEGLCTRSGPGPKCEGTSSALTKQRRDVESSTPGGGRPGKGTRHAGNMSSIITNATEIRAS